MLVLLAGAGCLNGAGAPYKGLGSFWGDLRQADLESRSDMIIAGNPLLGGQGA